MNKRTKGKHCELQQLFKFGGFFWDLCFKSVTMAVTGLISLSCSIIGDEKKKNGSEYSKKSSVAVSYTPGLLWFKFRLQAVGTQSFCVVLGSCELQTGGTAKRNGHTLQNTYSKVILSQINSMHQRPPFQKDPQVSLRDLLQPNT